MLNPGSKPIGAVVISSATFYCESTNLFSNNKQNNEKSYHFLQKLALQHT